MPSVEFLEDQFRKAKELGLNCLRCHIKAADPHYYEVADRMGLLIWTELPNGGMTTDRSRGRKEKLLKGLDDIGVTMERLPAIATFEEETAAARPWV